MELMRDDRGMLYVRATREGLSILAARFREYAGISVAPQNGETLPILVPLMTAKPDSPQLRRDLRDSAEKQV